MRRRLRSPILLLKKLTLESESLEPRGKSPDVEIHNPVGTTLEEGSSSESYDFHRYSAEDSYEYSGSDIEVYDSGFKAPKLTIEDLQQRITSIVHEPIYYFTCKKNYSPIVFKVRKGPAHPTKGGFLHKARSLWGAFRKANPSERSQPQDKECPAMFHASWFRLKHEALREKKQRVPIALMLFVRFSVILNRRGMKIPRPPADLTSASGFAWCKRTMRAFSSVSPQPAVIANYGPAASRPTKA